MKWLILATVLIPTAAMAQFQGGGQGPYGAPIPRMPRSEMPIITQPAPAPPLQPFLVPPPPLPQPPVCAPGPYGMVCY